MAQRLRRGSLKSTGLFGGGNNAQSQQQQQPSHETSNMESQQPTSMTNHSTVNSNNNTNNTNTTMLGNATSSKQRTFFKKRRQFTTSRSTDSESEETVEINPVNNRFHSVGSVDDFYCDDQKSISSERDLLYFYTSPSGGNLDRQLSPQYSNIDVWSSDEDDGDNCDDVISIQSFNSDRKRKRVCTRIINNTKRNSLEQFV